MTDDATITNTLTKIQVDIAALRGEVKTLAAELRADGSTAKRDLDALGAKVRDLTGRVDALEDQSWMSKGWAAGAAAAIALASSLLTAVVRFL